LVFVFRVTLSQYHINNQGNQEQNSEHPHTT
jgi:hypothetical protein